MLMNNLRRVYVCYYLFVLEMASYATLKGFMTILNLTSNDVLIIQNGM